MTCFSEPSSLKIIQSPLAEVIFIPALKLQFAVGMVE